MVATIYHLLSASAHNTMVRIAWLPPLVPYGIIASCWHSPS